jgi:WD40 repeat protein
MKLITIIIIAIATCRAVCGELKSPDGQYEIEYIKALEGDSNVMLKNAKTGKILGYAFSNGYGHSSYVETVWSPDSRYLAVVERGTRTTAEISLFSFVGDTVKEVRLPDYALNILGRKKLVTGGRYHMVSNLRWDKTTITFYCRGQWVDGSGDPAIDPENWYHFDVTLKLGGPGSAPQPRLIAVAEVDPKKKGEQDITPDR